MGEQGLPDLDVARVRRWCAERVPAHLHDQLRVEVDISARHLTVVECRPPWREDFGPDWIRFPIARLRYTKATGQWSLYWRDLHLRFHRYHRRPSSERIIDLLTEVDTAPTCIFSG